MMESQRVAYGEAIADLGKDERIVVLDADLSSSTHTIMFAKKYPGRFFNMGIQEQNEVGAAAGLARSGKIVFASSFAVFIVGRAYDVIRQSIAYTNLNVKIVVTHAGLTVGEDGATHQMLEDLGIMSGLPNFRVIAPGDAAETKKVIAKIAYTDGPFYVRLAREKVPTLLNDYDFDIGKGIVLNDGDDAAIISTGITLSIALDAMKELRAKGISAAVIHMPSIKPIDKEMVIKFARKTKKLITIEEHSIFNGLGSRVAEVLAENDPAKLKRIAVMDKFGESGPGWALLEKYGISKKNLVENVESMVR